MVTSRLFLTGITCAGRHGANPGEKDEPQAFVVDLDVEVESSGDELGQTADYRTIIRTARTTVEDGSFDLLETLANSVAAAVLALDGVAKVAAIVHKPAAAHSNDVQGVSAGATVER